MADTNAIKHFGCNESYYDESQLRFVMMHYDDDDVAKYLIKVLPRLISDVEDRVQHHQRDLVILQDRLDEAKKHFLTKQLAHLED